MDQFWLSLEKMVLENQPKIYILVILSLIVTGVFLILPNEKLNEKAKEHLPLIVIGSAIVFLATVLAGYLVQTFGV